MIAAFPAARDCGGPEGGGGLLRGRSRFERLLRDLYGRSFGVGAAEMAQREEIRRGGDYIRDNKAEDGEKIDEKGARFFHAARIIRPADMGSPKRAEA